VPLLNTLEQIRGPSEAPQMLNLIAYNLIRIPKLLTA
jgi:hypothetical protein